MSKARPGRGSRSSAFHAALQDLAGALHVEDALDVAATVLDVMRANPRRDRSRQAWTGLITAYLAAEVRRAGRRTPLPPVAANIWPSWRAGCAAHGRGYAAINSGGIRAAMVAARA